jgi:hypothetical protein
VVTVERKIFHFYNANSHISSFSFSFNSSQIGMEVLERRELGLEEAQNVLRSFLEHKDGQSLREEKRAHAEHILAVMEGRYEEEEEEEGQYTSEFKMGAEEVEQVEGEEAEEDVVEEGAGIMDEEEEEE